MNEIRSADHVLEVAREGATAYLRVLGRATFKVGPVLKQFGTAAIEDGCTRMALDVSACEGMDSTFMGVLAGLATRLARQADGKMIMVNVSDKLFEILSTLGLDQLIACYRMGTDPIPLAELPFIARAMSPIDATAADPQTTRQVMLEAHTTLAAVSDKNQLRFKDVLTYLREKTACPSLARENGSSKRE